MPARAFQLLILGFVGGLHAQDIARPSNAVALATSGTFVISTRNTAPAGQKAQPEVYEVVTGKDGSAAVTLGALGSVKLEANTQVRMPAAGAPQSLELLKGKLFLNIDAAELKKNQNTEFRLKTPAALLAVKGTQFFLETAPEQETIGVHEGAVAVATLAVRSTAMLQKGQAASRAPAQPVTTRAMTPEEQAMNAVYASVLPMKTAATALVVNGTTGMAEYRVKDDLTTVPQDDLEAISQLGATVMIVPEVPASCRLELTQEGVVRLFAVDAAPVLRLKLTLRLPGELKTAVAFRFYLRGGPDCAAFVDGRSFITTPANSRSTQKSPTPWGDCLFDLRTRRQLSSEHIFIVEARRTSSKTTSKQSPALELSDFTLISAPAVSP